MSSEETNDGNLGISNHSFFRQARKFARLVERKRQIGLGTRPRRTAELLVQETGRNDGGPSCLGLNCSSFQLLIFGSRSCSEIVKPWRSLERNDRARSNVCL